MSKTMQKVVYRKSIFSRFKSATKYIFEILKLMFKKHKFTTAIWIILTLGLSAFPSINVLLSKLSIDSINKIQSDNSYLKISFMYLIIIALMNVLNSILNGVLGIIFTRIKKDVNYYIQKTLYSKLKDIRLEKFEESVFYKRLSLAQEAIYRNCLDIIKYFFGVIQDILVVSGIIYILISIHWSLPIALLLSTIPGVIAIIVGKTMRYKLKWDNSPLFRKMGYTSGLFFNRYTIKEIKLFNIGGFLIQKWADFYNTIYKRDVKLTITEEKAKTFGVLILQVSNALVAMYLVSKIADNEITLGSFVSLTTAVTTIQGSLASMWGKVGEIFEINLSTRELINIINEDKEIDCSDSRTEVIDNIENIEISNLSFKYPGADINVINNISLSIKKGEKVAIVGDNGAGKTTLINLILGLYTSYTGKIQVNEIDFSKVVLKSYNKRVSAVLQDFIKYFYSLRENVALGDVSQIENESLIKDVLKKVGLGKKVDELNKGIDTLLSKEYEDGKELSGGEWQKVAIARAMIRESDLIVLDEPTAALDPLAELEIFDLFNRVSKDKTTLMISHRLGITRFADKILVLKNGEIVEQGSHDELVRLDGVYKKMYEAQANWYK